MSKFVKLFFSAPIADPYIVTIGNLTVSILVTIGLGLFMMLIYKMCHDSLTYHKNFNITLMMLSMITTVLLALIQNNPLLSLGVLGSLSICRIRSNTKDPRDLGFVFWALSIGISSAVGAFTAAILSSALIGMVLLVFSAKKIKKDTMLLIVRGDNYQLENVQKILSPIKGSSLQSKNIFKETFELVYEINKKEAESHKLIQNIQELDGISGVNVLAPETQIV